MAKRNEIHYENYWFSDKIYTVNRGVFTQVGLNLDIFTTVVGF
jgi:hypothetical protein